MSESDWSIPGALAAGTAAGFKASGAPDLALIAFPDGAAWSAVTTRHQLRAAPVRQLEAQLREDPRPPLKGIVINSGNANAMTGEGGIKAAKAMAQSTAQALDCEPGEVAVCSTGVIGVPLPMHHFRAGLPRAAAGLDAGGWTAAADAIRTTDDGPKLAWAPVELDDGTRLGAIGGIAKGAGMIAPNMATMLAFVTTDLDLFEWELDAVLAAAVAGSFNRISVDGDRSTNDVVILAATGKAPVPRAGNGHGEGGRQPLTDAAAGAIAAALNQVCHELAMAIVRDGEGARRIAEITVEGTLRQPDAETVARAIATSQLVKTAVYGGDPNWGRIAAAAGAVDVPMLEEGMVIAIGDVILYDRGVLPDADLERAAAAEMAKETVRIRVRLGRGPGKAVLWTSDLGHEYVTCNADYRT